MGGLVNTGEGAGAEEFVAGSYSHTISLIKHDHPERLRKLRSLHTTRGFWFTDYEHGFTSLLPM